MLVDHKFLKPGTFDSIFSLDNANTKSFYDYNFINAT
jgi:hypothetical protein